MRSIYAVGFSLAFALLILLAPPAWAQGSTAGFKACTSTFALCTVAPCLPIPGNDKQVSCSCTVNKGYSASQADCQGVKDTAQGQQIFSRYSPVKSYAVCSKDQPWAWCLDKPCIIDKNNPNAAACTCDLVKNLGDYVIVTASATQATCTTGVISSATVQGITEITDFLKTTKTLKPYPIQVVTPAK